MSERIEGIGGEPIDREQVEHVLQTDPLWYLDGRLSRVYDSFSRDSGEETEELRRGKTTMLDVVSKSLRDGSIQLGNTPEFFNDDDRVPVDEIDTVVLHHTATAEDMDIDTLDALGLLRLYVPLYKHTETFDVEGEKQPISSGHFRTDENGNRRQTFLGYHHIVRADGSILQTLKDEYTGFQAGDYSTNCRSIGVAFIGDLTDSEPTDEGQETMSTLKQQYPKARVIAHREVVQARTGEFMNTICPGNLFLKPDGWKQRL